MEESCTGLQSSEEELRKFLNEHPEFDHDIFDNPEVEFKIEAPKRKLNYSKLGKALNRLETALEEYANGGKGSGNFGHLGRPGKVGGSGKSTAITDFKGFRFPKQDELVEKYGLQELQKKNKGKRAAERAA